MACRHIAPRFLDDLAVFSLRSAVGGYAWPRVLRAIARHLRDVDVQHSVETGSGSTTLLFSRLSKDHTVFAVDGGGYLTKVRASVLLDPSTTRFIEGYTQITLPAYRFEQKIQVALLDGPHAFPFPALEYYYIHPHLCEGALLILDDIHIPSVHDFFRFLKADAMFRLIEVVERTAFFQRTSSPLFNLVGDDWEHQGYNRELLLRFVWQERLKEAVPPKIRRVIKVIWKTVHRSRSLEVR
jgi:hypothetical protein